MRTVPLKKEHKEEVFLKIKNIIFKVKPLVKGLEDKIQEANLPE